MITPNLVIKHGSGTHYCRNSAIEYYDYPQFGNQTHQELFSEIRINLKA